MLYTWQCTTCRCEWATQRAAPPWGCKHVLCCSSNREAKARLRPEDKRLITTFLKKAKR